MSMNGIDISSWQAGIDLNAVPCDFVIIKATQGVNYVNPDCDRAYQQAKKAGKLLGVYHYASSGGAVAEADFFLENIAGYIKEAVLVLDWEEGENANFYSADYAKVFLDRVYEKTGVRAMIYMSKSVCRQFNWSAVAKNHGLWVAQYASNDATGYQGDPWTDGNGYGAWSGPAIFQYSSNGRLSGYNGGLDINIAHMTKEAWGKYAGKTTAQTGWIKDSKGWWYKNADGTYPKSTWMQLNKKWYYFDDRGYMATGWVKWKGDWFYCDSSGVMLADQWLTPPNDKRKYYLKKDGRMAKLEILTFNEKPYAFLKDGRMATNIMEDGALK